MNKKIYCITCNNYVNLECRERQIITKGRPNLESCDYYVKRIAEQNKNKEVFCITCKNFVNLHCIENIYIKFCQPVKKTCSYYSKRT